MNRLVMLLVSTGLLLLAAVQLALGASGDELLKELGGDRQEFIRKGSTTDGSRINVPGAESGANLKRLLEKASEQEGQAPEQPMAQKGKIALRAEAGDGFAQLTWSVSSGGSLKSPLRFTVLYGTEPGRLDKRVEVDNATSFKLRELKNNQIYYVQINGQTKDRSITFYSDEEQVIPLSDENLTSLLERSFTRKPPTLQERVEADPFRRELKQFGYEFFKNSRATAASLENLPVGQEYVIGPGDTLRLDIWGSFQGRHELSVDRNGEILIPKVGVVKVWGLSFAQARDVIGKAISRYFRGYDFNLTLGKLRTIQIYVVGAVESPGAYAVSSLASVVDALAAAGGPTKSGTLRSIRVMRGDKLVQEIDCYDMLLSGDRSKDIRLENSDTIFVPVIGPVVAVAGEVKRAAIYEMKGATTLQDALAMAGGIARSADRGRIQVERIQGDNSLVVLDLKTAKDGVDAAVLATPVQDRDMVKVYPILPSARQVVSLHGNVGRPGDYQYRPGMRVTDLIPDHELLLPDTYLEAAEITRLIPPDYHREVISFSLRRALAGNPADNLELREQDSLKVFSRWEMQEKPVVAVNGQVVNPGVYSHFPNMTVRDLLTAAGSLKRNALLQNAELTRVTVKEGEAVSTHLFVDLEKVLAGDTQQNLTLQPDDTLIVRGVVNWLDANDRFVTLKGEVRYPGIYSIAKGERLVSVIRRAGGYADKAFLPGAKFTRKSVQELQQKRMDEVIARTEKDIIQKQGELASVASSKEEMEATRASLDGLLKGLDRLKGVKAEGRMVMRVAQPDELEKSPYNIELQGGDVLDIPQTPSVVSVIGEVYNQTNLVYLPEKTVSYYLKRAGGPSRNADEDEMYLIKADGSVYSRQQSTFGIRWDEEARSWTMGSFLANRVEPGDTLVVPQKLERIAWMRNIKDITTIVSQIALTAGTVFLWFK